MKGTCRLCEQESELRESHLIPAFAIRWIKETGSGYLRQATEPNRRKQDGPKYWWLCEPCEQKFSSREDYFSKTIFHPYIENEFASFTYDERLFYFAISILWRSLINNLDLPDIASHRFYTLMKDAERKWRSYLIGDSADPGYSSIQLFFGGISSSPTIPTKHFNMYLSRAIDSTVGSSSTECFMYAKFARFLFFGYLTECDQSKWIETQIQQSGGILASPQSIDDGQIGDFIVSRPREAFEKFENGINEKSKDVINRNFIKHKDRIIQSDQWRAQSQDSSKPIVYPESNRDFKNVGRNEPCPCGSGKKYKKCHGS